jgi:hypothetical protein
MLDDPHWLGNPKSGGPPRNLHWKEGTGSLPVSSMA